MILFISLTLILVIILILIKNKDFFTQKNVWFENKFVQGTDIIANPVINEDIKAGDGEKCVAFKDPKTGENIGTVNKYMETSSMDLTKFCDTDKSPEEFKKMFTSRENPIIDFSKNTELDMDEDTNTLKGDYAIFKSENKIKDSVEQINNSRQKTNFINGYGQDFDNFIQYYQHQICKKDTNVKKSMNEISYFENEELPAVASFLESKKQFIINVDDNEAQKKRKFLNFNDLFGTKHETQRKTDYVVSRGHENDIINDDEERKNPNNPYTTYICKECPVSTLQTYTFNPDEISSLKNLPSSEKDKRYGKYFVEKGGTRLNTNGKCELCSYQQGCFNPKLGRISKYQTQSCSYGQDRVCSDCKKCPEGIKYLTKFCGEGGEPVIPNVNLVLHVMIQMNTK